MKITVYELLGMVKDGNAPKRILYDNYIWSWTGDDYRTILKDGKEQFLITGMYYAWLTEFLNDEVEILEEPKGIPEKICTNRIINTKDILEFEMIQNKINAEYTYAINWILDYLESKGDE